MLVEENNKNNLELFKAAVYDKILQANSKYISNKTFKQVNEKKKKNLRWTINKQTKKK